MKTERKKLIERLRKYEGTSLAPALMAQAAIMLEADAAPQEPVAIIRCWTKNGEGHSELVDWCCPGIESLPDGEHKLFAAPQQRPRLTDGEVCTAYIEATNQTLRPQFEALLVGVALVSIFAIGWITAHSEVVTECERLGAFYVGDKTFKCERVKP